MSLGVGSPASLSSVVRQHRALMKMTPRQWLDEIAATRKQKGKDSWYTASCPMCTYSQDATVLSSDAVAETAVRVKVLAHIRMSHKEHVVDDTTSAM